MNTIKTISLFILTISVAIIAYKMPDLSSFKLWTVHDEIILAEELKGITDKFEKLEYLKEKRKNTLAMSVSVDSGNIDVYLQNFDIPVKVISPVDVIVPPGAWNK